MTYMWPNYYQVEVKSRLAYKYQLLQYSHNELTPREKQLKSDKVVIFVPGNSGSSEQVRSIGKEVIQKLTQSGLLKSTIAFYSLDFRSELSALSGLILEEQSEFFVDSLHAISILHVDDGILKLTLPLKRQLQDTRKLFKGLESIPRLEQCISLLKEFNKSVFEPAGILTVEKYVQTFGSMDVAASIDGRHRDALKFTQAGVEQELRHFVQRFETANYAIEEKTNALKDDEQRIRQQLHDLREERKARFESLQIILIGHSMGGIVSRNGMMKLEDSLRGRIKAVITLSTPNRAPLVGPDISMYRVYERIRHEIGNETIYISIAGGYRDNLIPGILTPFDADRFPHSAVALTKSMVGLSTDHLSILWCNEVVMKIRDDIFRIFNGGASDVLETYRQYNFTKRGFTRAIQRSIPNDHPLQLWFSDVFARWYILDTPMYTFAIGLVQILMLGGRIPMQRFVIAAALFFAMFCASIAHWELCFVPIVSVSLAVAISHAVIFIAGVVLRRATVTAFRYVPPHIICSSLVVALYATKHGATIPSISELMASVVLILLVNFVLMLADSFPLLSWKAPIVDTQTPEHVQAIYSIIYLSAACSWVGMALFCTDIIISPKSTTHSKLNEVEFFMMVLSVVCLLPVQFHLYVLRHAPSYASHEKVLDSFIERVKVDTPQNNSSQDTPVFMEKLKKKVRTQRSSEILSYSYLEDNEVLFEDSKNKSKVRFANGEEIQIDDIDYSARFNDDDRQDEAVDLIAEPPKPSNIDCYRVERVRLASSVFASSKSLDIFCAVVALMIPLLGARYIFILQYISPALAIISINTQGTRQEEIVTRRTLM